MNKPHLLYIAFFYPPSRASGVYRALATSQAFVNAGWDVTVITVDEHFLDDELGSSDRSLVEMIPQEVVVDRVPFSFARHGDFPFETAGQLAGRFPGIYFKMQERAQRKRSYPDKYKTWIEPVLEKIKDSEVSYDHILATGNPYASFEIARVAAENLGIEFSVDYRDPWSFDASTSGPIDDPQVVAAEERVISEARFCFHVNRAIASAYANRFPGSDDKHIVAMNGYDEPSLGPIHSPAANGPLRFGVVGTLTERWPLEGLFSGWQRAFSQLPPGSELIFAGYLGFFESTEELIKTVLPTGLDGFTYAGPISKGDVGGFNGQLDVVVTPVPEGKMVTGSKVFEAAAIGIPVVCIQSAGGGAYEVFDQHPYVFGASPTPESVETALLAAAAASQRMTSEEPAQIRANGRSLERLQSLQPLVRAVSESIDNQPISR